MVAETEDDKANRQRKLEQTRERTGDAVEEIAGAVAAVVPSRIP